MLHYDKIYLTEGINPAKSSHYYFKHNVSMSLLDSNFENNFQ